MTELLGAVGVLALIAAFLVFITVLAQIYIAEDYGRSFVLSVFCITLTVAVL